MFRFALAVFIIFTIKKPSLVGSNSVCYSFHYEEVFDTNESLIPSSLWQIRQEYGLNVRSENALKLLLILAGDIELCPGPVVRYSTNDTNERPRLRGFKVAHLNVRSMINKMDALRILVEEKSFDIFTISETWLSQSILDSEVNISGYTLVRQDRDGRSSGGTAIFVREGIPYLHRKDLLYLMTILKFVGLRYVALIVRSSLFALSINLQPIAVIH
jgi:hypothetical protein